MKVTDTHGAAAEHFDYLDRLDRDDPTPDAASEEALQQTERSTDLDQLIEATSRQHRLGDAHAGLSSA